MCLEKIITPKSFHLGGGEDFPLYCRAMGFIDDVCRNCFIYCKCIYEGDKTFLWDVYRFNRDLLIFYKSELQYLSKKNKIKTICRVLTTFLYILNHWKTIKSEYFYFFCCCKSPFHSCID